MALGHQRVRGGLGSKERGSKLFGGGLHLVCRPLVSRQVDDQLADALEVGFPRLAYGRMHRPILTPRFSLVDVRPRTACNSS
jgi:hypothetical protein